ncbi:hypothetical protein CU098_008333 [Rhizopus stolonifer]|uniref:Methyltransferase domain-containing protein n=1 Tax=Rhizopus stolonifer TaxID=4846 RepID=A0A367JDV3_RHIST|nr:hypothetical protein CU098_008333 [Rhizopus stolonifer]
MGNAQSSGDNTSVITDGSYPSVNKRRPPPANPYNFFDQQFVSPPPSTSPRKQSTVTTDSSKSQNTNGSNKSAKENINYFEVAAVTSEPLTSPKKPSSNPSTPASSIKKSYINSASHIHQLTPTASRSSTSSTIRSQNKANSMVVDGRAYLKDHVTKSFMLPCDDDEADRLMTLHYILKTMFQWNFISPVHELLSSEKKHKVLDIGCGPGTWILEMATEYPNAEFYGMDECSLFPTSIKPGNANFQIHNILKGPLPYEDESFDFIYMRSMMLYLSPADLSNLLSEVYRIMKPGAYFEVVDTNYTIRRAGPLSNSIINTELKQKINPVGQINTTESNTHHPIFTFLMMTTPQQPTIHFLGHFLDISQDHVALPVGHWTGQQLDILHTQNFKSFLTALHVQDRPLAKKEIDDILEECERYKSYLDWFACYARKPSNQDDLEQNTLDSIDEFVQGFVDI